MYFLYIYLTRKDYYLREFLTANIYYVLSILMIFAIIIGDKNIIHSASSCDVYRHDTWTTLYRLPVYYYVYRYDKWLVRRFSFMFSRKTAIDTYTMILYKQTHLILRHCRTHCLSNFFFTNKSSVYIIP